MLPLRRDTVEVCELGPTEFAGFDVLDFDQVFTAPDRPPAWGMTAGTARPNPGSLSLSSSFIEFLLVVPKDGIEPPTRGFSVPCSTN